MKEVKSSEKTTLLLNNAWQASEVITAREAFNHLIRGRVTALDHDSVGYYSLESWVRMGEMVEDQPCLRSISGLWPIPTMVVTTDKFFKPQKKTKLNVYELAKIHDNECRYCHEVFPLAELTIDHVHPKSKGGLDVHENRVLSCGRCNRRKGSTTPWPDRNGNIPKAPKIPSIIVSKKSMRKEWKPFIES